MKNFNFWIAVALIIGTVIGAGILGIPYVIAQVGWIPGLINFALVGFATTLMTLYAGEVVLRTKKSKQFIGLAEKYLGKNGKWLMFASMVIGIYGALIAYLVGIGESAYYLLGFGSPLFFSILFFIFAAIIIFLGLSHVGRVELILSFTLVLVILIISLSLLPEINLQNFSYNHFDKIFLPYGVILFAFLGYSIIPEVELTLKRNKRKMSKAIIFAMIICTSLYILFSYVMLGVYGKNVDQIATNSLSGILKIFGSSVAILAMATGFLTLGTVVRDIFRFDLGLNKNLSWILAVFVPLILFLAFSPSFVSIISITGTYTGSLAGILSCLMVISSRKKSDEKPAYVVPGGRFLIYFSILVFLFGIIYQTFLIFGFI